MRGDGREPKPWVGNRILRVTSRRKTGVPVSRATHDRCRPPDATLLTFVLDFWNGLIVHTHTHPHFEASRHKSARGWRCIGWCSRSGLTSTFCRLTVHARPLKRIAHSTTLASNQTTSVSKDNAAQGGVRAQTFTPLRAGRYRPKSRQAPHPRRYRPKSRHTNFF